MRSARQRRMFVLGHGSSRAPALRQHFVGGIAARMKILVTGANGFIGSHVCRVLLRDGHEVTVLHRQTSDLKPLGGLDLRHAIGDVLDPQSLGRAIRGQEVVIHAAAQTPGEARGAAEQSDINVAGTRNVLSACLTHGTRRVMHVSSVAAIGISTDPQHPADETFRFNLEGRGFAYHWTKHLAEQEVYKAAASGLDVVIVNPGFAFGAWKGGYRGGYLMRQARRRWINPTFPGGFCIVHVADVVAGMVSALWSGRKGERYVLGGENVSHYRIATETAMRLGLKRIILRVPPALARYASTVSPSAYDPEHCHQYYDSRKAQVELGFRSQPFSSIVKDYLDSEGPAR